MAACSVDGALGIRAPCHLTFRARQVWAISSRRVARMVGNRDPLNCEDAGEGNVCFLPEWLGVGGDGVFFGDGSGVHVSFDRSFADRRVAHDGLFCRSSSLLRGRVIFGDCLLPEGSGTTASARIYAAACESADWIACTRGDLWPGSQSFRHAKVWADVLWCGTDLSGGISGDDDAALRLETPLVRPGSKWKIGPRHPAFGRIAGAAVDCISRN